MTERKTDVLNLRLDASLAGEIDRIAQWRGKTASEVARELLQYGVAVERDLEAEELRRHYSAGHLDRNAESVRIDIEARYRFLSPPELAAIEAAINEAEEYA
jgi:hypothetical protein